MAATITDLVTKASNGTRPIPTTLTAIRSIGATSISCGALTGWPTDTPVHFSIYRVGTDGKKVAGSQTDWKGIVSGNTITGLQLKDGSDNGDSVGAVVQAGPTAAWADDMAKHALVSTNQDGSLKSTSVNTAIATGTITTAKLADGAVTPAKRAGGFFMGTFTARTTIGTQAITGLGFKPKLVEFKFMPTTSTGSLFIMNGSDDGTTRQVAGASLAGTNVSRWSTTAASLNLRGAGTTTSLIAGTVSTMDADGFTINVSETDAGAYTFGYVAYA